MAARNFNELKSISHEQFFGEMEISGEEKQKRIELARRLESVFSGYMENYSNDKGGNHRDLIVIGFMAAAVVYMGLEQVPDYIRGYAERLADEVARATEAHPGEDWYLSAERAATIAQNEANTIANYALHVEAVKDGKKYKTWKTMKDIKVRETHRELDEKTIGIFEPFEVGDSLMMFPRDGETFGASTEEMANCRCIVVYS